MTTTLLLTSAGIKVPPIDDELRKILRKPANKTKLAHITTASNVADDVGYVERDKKVMRKMGFIVEDIDIVDQSVNGDEGVITSIISFRLVNVFDSIWSDGYRIIAP